MPNTGDFIIETEWEPWCAILYTHCDWHSVMHCHMEKCAWSYHWQYHKPVMMEQVLPTVLAGCCFSVVNGRAAINLINQLYVCAYMWCTRVFVAWIKCGTSGW